MPTSILSTTGAGTWTPPADCPAGTIVTVEAWGAGSGGSGTGATNGGGGAGGAYAAGSYSVTQYDIINASIPYSVGAGGAGNTGTGSVGGDTFWGSNINIVPNSSNVGAVVGAPGTAPTGWALLNVSTVIASIVGLGNDASTGMPYIDIRFNGTFGASSPGFTVNTVTSTIPCLPSVAYTASFYYAMIAGSLTNITGWSLTVDEYNSGLTYAGASGIAAPANPTGSLVRQTVTWTNNGTAAYLNLYTYFTGTNGNTVDITLRYAGFQIEQASSATAYRVTPSGYVLAKGGPAPITTGGGIGTATGSIGGLATFAGGSGRAYNAAGSPGGGAAGKDGAGVSASTTTSGAGDNGSGGAGVAVASAAPGTAGTSNVEGGAGGGALITAAGVAGAGGVPGGGGGGSDAGSGTRTGGAGGNGQIRLSYAPPVESPNTINTTEIQDGQAGASLTPARIRRLVDGVSGASSPTAQTGSFTFDYTHRGCVVPYNSAGAGNATIPPYTAVPFPVGTVLQVGQAGTGAVSFVAGPGVTFVFPHTLTSFGQGSIITAWQASTNIWWIGGDTT